MPLKRVTYSYTITILFLYYCCQFRQMGLSDVSDRLASGPDTNEL
jgi:hypothetical protein